MSGAKKLHPSDAANLAAIAGATHFRCHFRKGAHEVYAAENLPTLEIARDQARMINEKHGQFGRRCAIYALVPGRAAILVPDSYQPEAVR